MAAALFFTYASVVLGATVNALRPPSPPTSRFPPLWLPAMLTSELAPVWAVSRVAISGLFVWAGALAIPMGWAALGLVGISEIGLAVVMRRTGEAVRQARSALPSGGIPKPQNPRERVGLVPRLPRDLRLDTHIPYFEDLTLDLYRHRDLDAASPCLIYVHGGGWTGGGPHKQARVLFHELARRGWIVATIRYPLSPHATFPEHLIGVKRAIAWAKDTPEQGIDPHRIVIAGGSAGGHLASLAALTADQRHLQPDFQDADTSVAACMSLYAVYDFFNRHHTRHDWPVIPRHVMKATPSDDPERYRQASPIDQVGPHAPPFLVIHGSHDSLVPPREAHHFVEALHGGSSALVEYLEIPGAQHAFDALGSPRSRAVAGLMAAFAEDVVAASRPSER